MDAPQPSLKSRALRLLAGREHSRAELERKLARHAPEPAELAAALDALQAKGFINEQRVLDSVVHRRAGQFGQRRLQQELQQRGLDPDAIAGSLAQLKDSELARARAVRFKKFGDAPPASAADRSKQMRFLLGRGFDGEVVRRAMGQSADEHNDDHAPDEPGA